MHCTKIILLDISLTKNYFKLFFTTDTTTEATMSSTVSVFQYTTLQTAATTTSIQNGTGQALCVCSCSQNGTIPTATLAPHESLVIDKKGLSSYRNSRICIADNRPSAVALGSLGVGIIVLFALLIVLPDAVRLLRFIVNKCWLFRIKWYTYPMENIYYI